MTLKRKIARSLANLLAGFLYRLGHDEVGALQYQLRLERDARRKLEKYLRRRLIEKMKGSQGNEH